MIIGNTVGVAPATFSIPSGAIVPQGSSNQRTSPENEGSDPEDEISATLQITAPLDVTISVNGRALNRKTETQAFRSPTLPKGRTYAYTVTAKGKQNGEMVERTKRVLVKAGVRQQIDFSSLVPNRALVKVKLPTDAQLFVDGVRIPVQSGVNTFNSPELEQGRTYRYTMEAKVVRSGKTHRQTKRLEVRAGKTFDIEFDQLPTVQTASR